MRSSGFTLVETLVAVAVLTIFFGAIIAISHISLQNLAVMRTRETAAMVAQSQLELARNLPYESVGTIGGIPAGDLIQDQTLTQKGQEFRVETTVVYIDDPFDDTAPDDPIPTDYKRISVAVSWEGPFASQHPLKLWTDISPKGLETAEDVGTLSILVFNSLGEPVPSAQVHIKADSVNPPVDLNMYTDSTGRVLLPGASECIECYQISVTKSGFTTDRTFGSEEVTNPTKPHATILEGEITNISFAIDRVSSVTFTARRSAANNYAPFQGVQLLIRGTKVIGYTTLDQPVYKHDEAVVTGFGGTVTVSDLEWDTYTVSLPTGASVDFAGSWPFSPFSLSPGQNLNFTAVVVPATSNSLLLIAQDAVDSPIASSSVILSNPYTSFIATQSTAIGETPDRGQTFFPNLSPGLYDLQISSPDYLTATASVNIVGDSIERFILEINDEN